MSEEKLTPAEHAKINGNYLRGTIAADLAGESDQFEKDNQATPQVPWHLSTR